MRWHIYGLEGLSPDRVVQFQALTGHSVVFLSRTLHSRSATLQPGVEIGIEELNAEDNPTLD